MNLFNLLFRRPASRQAIRSQRHEPQAIAQTMDAGRISDILRAAEAGNMDDYFALARDIVCGHSHTVAEFAKRKLAVLAETQSFLPADAENPAQVGLAKSVGQHLGNLPSWYTAMVHLLDSTLYPVAVLKKIYAPCSRPGWRYELADLIPIPYHLLSFETGTMRIRDVNEDGSLAGTSHAPDPLRYVVHRGHLLTSAPDTWGGPMRAVLFWWLFSTQNRDWWSRFLERFGAPFLEGSYDKSDDSSRAQLERAFNSATRLFGIAVPDDASVKIHQANTSQGGDAFEKFHSTANREISKIIVGQTLSAEGQNLGLGGGQAQAQDGVRSDLRQFDAIMLAFTVRTQILTPLCAINGWSGEPPRIAWGGDDVEDLQTLSTILERLAKTNIYLTDDGVMALSKRMSLPLMRDLIPRPRLGPLSALASPPPGQSGGGKSAVDAIAAASADPFAKEMAATIAPLAAIVSEATSISDLEARLLRAIPSLDTRRASQIAEAAIVASTANAALGFRTE